MSTLISIGRKNAKPAADAQPEVLVPEDEIRVSATAAEQIRVKLTEEGEPDGVFRVGIMGGGCSGLSYLFKVEAAAEDRDRVFDANGVRVVVDPKSLKLIGGTLLDWKSELGAHGFEMRNPHVKSACSCGASFTV
jgi:iron-sulfur cluster assembly protein